jgi:hypothetical protein
MGTGHLRASRGAWRNRGLRGLLLAALVVLTWPIYGITPYPGIDQSWVIALSLAHSDGLAWGREVVFTYGPLGFGAFPKALSAGVLFWGLLLAGIVQLLLVGTLYAGVRRRYGPLVSAVLTFLVACTVAPGFYDATTAIGFAVVALALTVPEQRAERAGLALALGGAVLAAFALLLKINAGIAVTALILIGLLGMPRPKRNLPVAIGAGVVALVVFWLLAGQPLAALGDYLRNALDTVSGYVEAMGLDEGGPSSQWHLAVILVSALTLTVLAWTSLPGLPDRRRGALAVAVLAVHYFILREIFLRHNLERGAAFAILIVVAMMIPWPRERRALGLAISAALALAFLASTSTTVKEIWSPRSHAHDFAHQAHAVVDASTLDRERSFGKATVEQVDAVPAKVIAALRGRCVNSEPTEVAAIWGYDLEWCPVPAIQSYSAYTPRLDSLDADSYADAESGPNGVLRLDFGLDGRLPAWESPEAMLAMLCNFRSLVAEGSWQALARVPRRCGEARPAGSVEGTMGEPIEIPPAPPGTVLLARVHGLEIGGLEKLSELFGRPAERRISINGEPPHRVVPGTLGDGLILDVPKRLDYPSPFNLGQDVKTLTADVAGGDGTVTIDLEAVPIEAPAKRAG